MASILQTASVSDTMSDIEKQELRLDTVELRADDQTNAHILSDVAPVNNVKAEAAVKGMKPGGGLHGGGRGLPPNHPMHPSQFSGDRFERVPLLTLLGSFCVMVRLPKDILGIFFANPD
jgi:hypothetical protein